MAYSRYYRYKLSNSQKKLYDALLDGIEKGETEINCPYYEDKNFSNVVTALNFDDPSLYYVDFSHIKIGVTSKSCLFNVSYYCDKSARNKYDKKIAAVVSSIVGLVTGKTMKSAALTIHDWLVSNCTYGNCDIFPNASHSIIGALLYSKCVCEGYAKAYKYLADAIKMRCMTVLGNAVCSDGTNGRHAWNIIRLNKYFYHVDVTFDLLFANKYCSRAYFLLSTKEVLHDHTIDETFEVPTCAYSGSILKTVSGTKQLLTFLESECRKKVTHSEVRLTKGFPKEKMMSMIRNKISAKDVEWVSQIKTYWYGDYCRTLFVCWR